jgi:hypothetical protein
VSPPLQASSNSVGVRLIAAASSFPTLYSFVRKFGRTSGQRFETDAAIAAGASVHNEVKRAGRCR